MEGSGVCGGVPREDVTYRKSPGDQWDGSYATQPTRAKVHALTEPCTGRASVTECRLTQAWRRPKPLQVRSQARPGQPWRTCHKAKVRPFSLLTHASPSRPSLALSLSRPLACRSSACLCACVGATFTFMPHAWLSSACYTRLAIADTGRLR